MNIFSGFLTVKDGFSEYGSVNKKGKGAENADKKAKMKAGRDCVFHLPVLFLVVGRRNRRHEHYRERVYNGSRKEKKWQCHTG